MLLPLRLLMFIVADISAVIVLAIAEGDMLGIFEQSGKLGLQAIAIAGLVIVWRKLEKIEKKREVEWTKREKEFKDRDQAMLVAVEKLTEDLHTALKHHDDFSKIAQQERLAAARTEEEARQREEKQFTAVINNSREWQSLLLQIHKEATTTLRNNTAVGIALVRVLRAKQPLALTEVSGHDIEQEKALGLQD